MSSSPALALFTIVSIIIMITYRVTGVGSSCVCACVWTCALLTDRCPLGFARNPSRARPLSMSLCRAPADRSISAFIICARFFRRRCPLLLPRQTDLIRFGPVPLLCSVESDSARSKGLFLCVSFWSSRGEAGAFALLTTDCSLFSGLSSRTDLCARQDDIVECLLRTLHSRLQSWMPRCTALCVCSWLRRFKSDWSRGGERLAH